MRKIKYLKGFIQMKIRHLTKKVGFKSKKGLSLQYKKDVNGLIGKIPQITLEKNPVENRENILFLQNRKLFRLSLIHTFRKRMDLNS